MKIKQRMGTMMKERRDRQLFSVRGGVGIFAFIFFVTAVLSAADDPLFDDGPLSFIAFDDKSAAESTPDSIFEPENTSSEPTDSGTLPEMTPPPVENAASPENMASPESEAASPLDDPAAPVSPSQAETKENPAPEPLSSSSPAPSATPSTPLPVSEGITESNTAPKTTTEAEPQAADAGTTEETPADAVPTEETESIPLFESLIKVPDTLQTAIQGKELTLSDLLQNVNQPQVRQRKTEAYWELSGKLAAYHLSVIHANDVEECIARHPAAELTSNQTAILLSARRVAAQGVKRAEIEFIEAQYRFEEENRGSASMSDPRNRSNRTFADEETFSADALSIPVDLPTTVSYSTRYDEIIRQRRVGAKAKSLDAAIPIQFEAVKAWQRAADETLAAFKQLYFNPAVTSDELLLSAADRHAEAKENLVRAVVTYNRMIAVYVAETVGGNVRGDRLMTTMILKPKNQNSPMTAANPPMLSPRAKRNPASSGVTPIASAVPPLAEKRNVNPVSAEIPSPREMTSNGSAETLPDPPAALQFAPAAGKNTPSDRPGQNRGRDRQAPGTNSPQPNGGPQPNGLRPPMKGDAEPLIIRGQLPDDPGPVESDSPYPTPGADTPSLMPPESAPDSTDSVSPDTASADASAPTEKLNPETSGTVASSSEPTAPTEDGAGTDEKNQKTASLDLSAEEDQKLRSVTAAIFVTPATSSGAGDSKIIEIQLSLHDALSRAGENRLDAVESYWRLRCLIATLAVENQIHDTASGMLDQLTASAQESPELTALTATWRAALASSEARQAETKVEIRAEQVTLMTLSNRSPDQGWPIPSSFPWYGNYSLASDSVKVHNFRLAVESVLIPEKIRAVYADGFALGPVESLFKPEMATLEKMDDGYLYLKTLENKRLAALGYMRAVESLNNSIARYVNAFSATLDAKTFADCLIGSDEE